MGKKEAGNSTTWRQKLSWHKEGGKFVGQPSDVVILVMGPTGVGKSTFIKEYTKSDEVPVGHHLKSCTRDVTCYEATTPPAFRALQGRRLILVDTPGFDDTFSDDSEILRRVSGWLANSYNEHMPVAGIIYMNDISQKRMYGSTRMNLKMFTKLCGEESFKKVVMATSQWDTLPNEAVGLKRQEELKATFWQQVTDGGARVMRIGPSSRSADQDAIVNHLLQSFINNEHKDRALQIQKEIVDLEKSIPATQAGKELKYTLEELLRLQKAAQTNALDENGKRELEEKMSSAKRQIKALKLSFSERLKSLLGM